MNKNKSILDGIIGSFLFALLFSIPWLIYHTIYDQPLIYLGLLTPFGAYYGYLKFKGKKSDYQLLIIISVTLIVSLITCYLILPILYLIKNSNLSIESYLDIFKWIEQKIERFDEYIDLITINLIGIAVIYVMRWPELPFFSVNNAADYRVYSNHKYEIDGIREYFSKNNAVNESNATTIDYDLFFNWEIIDFLVKKEYIVKLKNGYYYYDFAKENYDLNYKKPNLKAITISVLASLFMIISSIVIPSFSDFINEDIENSTKYVENEVFTYDMPNDLYVYKYGEYDWLLMSFTSENYNGSGITLDALSIKDEYNSKEKLYNYFYDQCNDVATTEGAELLSIDSSRITPHKYEVIELVLNNYRNAKHLLYYVIDNDYEYCAIVECTCYEDNKEIVDVANRIVNSIEFK